MDYPRPIATCDLQFNHLLDRREGIHRELDRLRKTAQENRQPMNRLNELIERSGHFDEETKQELATSLRQGVEVEDAEGL